MSSVVLITGANRGIGLGLVKEYCNNNWKVLATCRQPEKADQLKQVLSNHGQPEPLECDISNDTSIHRCLQQVKEHTDKLNLLINNAGISNATHPVELPSKVDRAEFLHIMDVNVAGPIKVTQAFLPLLLNGDSPKVATVGSSLGSVAMADSHRSTSYRCSKAAINMVSKVFASEFPSVLFLTLHPGHVKTDMGQSQGRTAPVEIQESAAGIARVVKDATKEQSGLLIDWNGKQLPF